MKLPIPADATNPFTEMYLNNRTDSNVYFSNYFYSENEGFRMYWSLKYGIIRFEGELGEIFYSWNLDLGRTMKK